MKNLISAIMIVAILLVLGFAVYEYDSIGNSDDAIAVIDNAENKKDTLKGKVVKAGLYKVIRSGGLVESRNTSTGKAISKPVIELVTTTDRIPLVKDAHMSMQYRIWNLPEQPAYIKLRRVLKHPVMTLPDGTQSSGSDYMINGSVSIGQVIAYTGYGLNEDYEMLEGEWTFQIWYEDKKLVEHTFTTYWPDETENRQIESISVTANSTSLTKAGLSPSL